MKNLLSLPMELLVYIVSFLTTYDKAKHVRHTFHGDYEVCVKHPHCGKCLYGLITTVVKKSCVNNVLRVNGPHVNRLAFPHHVTLPKLFKMLKQCSNLIELSLPRIVLEPKQLGKVLQHVRRLQRLDIQWNTNIKQLLQVVGVNLKELTIRVKPYKGFYTPVSTNIDSFLHYWMSTGFSPQNLTIVDSFQYNWVGALSHCWYTSNSRSPAGRTGHIKVYRSLKASLHMYPVLPEFQIDFGGSVTQPYVKPGSVGLLLELEGIYLNLTDSKYSGKAVQMVKLMSIHSVMCKDSFNHSITNLQSVVEFDVSCCRLCPEHLKQIGITCPNLQRLNLMQTTQHSHRGIEELNTLCLANLDGLNTIASCCHNLQGLSLLGIPVKEVENQTRFWEILSDMRLTHLAVNLCMLLPSAKNEQKLISLLKKCSSLQALELTSCCSECTRKLTDKSLFILSQFPSLIHCVFTTHSHHCSTVLHDILISCGQLKCLNYTESGSTVHSFSVIDTCNLLQQLCI